jgi:hypothetical protein
VASTLVALVPDLDRFKLPSDLMLVAAVVELTHQESRCLITHAASVTVDIDTNK